MSEKKPIDLMLDKVEWKAGPEPAQADLGDGIPYATHSGILDLFGHSLKVFRLSTGIAIIDADDLAEFFEGLLGEEDPKGAITDVFTRLSDVRSAG